MNNGEKRMEREMLRFCPAAAFAAVLFMPLLAQAQDSAAGAEVARNHCAGCHQVGERPRSRFGFAPAFAEIAAANGTTETSIVVFLSTPHEPMPNYMLTQKEIHDVAAYIVGLRRP